MEPGQSLDYAWDEPNHTRKLRCELDGAHGAALREPATRTYALDEIKVRRRRPALPTQRPPHGRRPALYLAPLSSLQRPAVQGSPALLYGNAALCSRGGGVCGLSRASCSAGHVTATVLWGCRQGTDL